MQKSGSISQWCKEIVLDQGQKERLVKNQENGGKKGREKFSRETRRRNKKITEALKRRGLIDVGILSDREFFISGIALYFSEGYKYAGGNQVGFTNSDYRVILFMIKWFKKFCKVSDDRFSFQIKINKIHSDRIKTVERYWLKILKMPASKFNKTIFIKSKSKKVYSNFNNYFGTMRITVRECPNLRQKINGWVGGLFQNLSAGVVQ